MNKLKTRGFGLLAVLTIMMMVLTACAPAAPATPQVVKETVVVVEEVEKVVTPTPPAQREKVTLRFGMYGFEPWIVTLKRMFVEFEAQNPHIKVKLEIVPDYFQYAAKVMALTAAGNPWDVFAGDPNNSGPWADKGILLDLGPLVERDGLNLDDWFPSTVNMCRFDVGQTRDWGQGTLYGMPATAVAGLYFYNQDLFDKAGVTYPTTDWTWDDLLAMAQKLTLDNKGRNALDPAFDPNNIVQFGLRWGTGADQTIFAWAAGGELLSPDGKKSNINSPEVIQAWQFMADLIHKYHVVPTPEQAEGLTEPFLSGRVAMALEGTWYLDSWAKNAKFRFDVVPPPIGPGGAEKRATFAGPNCIQISGESKHPDEAWELVKFMVGPSGMKYFAETGVPALRTTAYSDLWLKPGQPPENRIRALDAVEVGRVWYYGPGSAEWKINVMLGEMDKLWLGKETAAETAARISEKVDKILAEAHK